jgi:hypothetical protein
LDDYTTILPQANSEKVKFIWRASRRKSVRAGVGRGARQRRALQNFFIRLVHANSKAAIDASGK